MCHGGPYSARKTLHLNITVTEIWMWGKLGPLPGWWPMLVSNFGQVIVLLANPVAEPLEAYIPLLSVTVQCPHMVTELSGTALTWASSQAVFISHFLLRLLQLCQGLLHVFLSAWGCP